LEILVRPCYQQYTGHFLINFSHKGTGSTKKQLWAGLVLVVGMAIATPSFEQVFP
jgi:hypothetical protein